MPTCSADGLEPKKISMGASTQTLNQLAAPADPTTPEQRAGERAPATTCQLPLTAALLDVALHSVSFATPGHRGGRSWQFTTER